MKIRKLISFLAATAMAVTAVTGAMSVSALSADDGEFDPNAYYTSGKCGTNANWLINSDGVLVISGTGEMTKLYEAVPDNDIRLYSYWGWEKLSQGVNEVVVENDITTIPEFCISDRIKSVSKITLPSSLTKLNRCLLSYTSDYENLKDVYVYSKNISDASTIYASDSVTPWSGSGIIWHVYKGSATEASLKNDLHLTDEDIEYIPDDEQMPTVSNKTPAKLEPVGETSGPAGVCSKYEWNESSKTLEFSGKFGISIGEYYKQYAEETEHIIIKSGITAINSNTGIGSGYYRSAFTGFTSLKDVQLPDTLQALPTSAFYGTSLEEINFPDTLNKIGECAFNGTKLKSIKLHEGMTIGGGAFHGCESLKEVTIPKNVYLVNTYKTGGAGMARAASTFANCTGLEKVVIEDGSILDNAFFSGFLSQNGIPEGFCNGCTSLKTVIIRGGVEYIGSSAFGGSLSIGVCASLTDMYFYNTGLNTISAKGAGSEGVHESITVNDSLKLHVIKGSQTEQTLKEAGYLTKENTVYIADTTDLETAISEAEDIDTSKYTDESVSEFTKAIENAKALLDNMDATQEEVDNAVKAIEDAKNALADKSGEPSSDNTSDSSNSSGNNNQSQSPNTPATPATSAPTTATPKSTTPPTVTTTAAKPAKVKAVKLKAKKKKLNVSWKKVSGATGYEVLSATNNKFTKGKKTVTVKKNKVTLKRLKSKKKYFVKVRAYKLANGRKYFGKWSKVVKKKTK